MTPCSEGLRGRAGLQTQGGESERWGAQLCGAVSEQMRRGELQRRGEKRRRRDLLWDTSTAPALSITASFACRWPRPSVSLCGLSGAGCVSATITSSILFSLSSGEALFVSHTSSAVCVRMLVCHCSTCDSLNPSSSQKHSCLGRWFPSTWLKAQNKLYFTLTGILENLYFSL